MSKDIKRMIRFFTIAEWEAEEVFLKEQHKKGWKFKKFTLPCFYTFEKCEPEEVVYKLDFANHNSEDAESYRQMFKDEGWEYLCVVNDFSYFRKRNTTQEELEIFSDMESRLDMVERVQKKRLLPLVTLFLCCVLPQLTIVLTNGQIYGKFADAITAFWIVMLAIYVWLLADCGIKLKKLKNRYQR